MTRHRHTPHHRGWRLCGGLRHVRRTVPLRQHGGWLSSTLPPATVHLPSSLARRQWQSAPISRWRPLHGHAARDSGRQPKRSAQYDQQPMAGKRRQWRCTPIRRWNRWCGLAAQSCKRQSWKGVAVSTSLIHPWRVIRTLTAPFAPKMPIQHTNDALQRLAGSSAAKEASTKRITQLLHYGSCRTMHASWGRLTTTSTWKYVPRSSQLCTWPGTRSKEVPKLSLK